MRNWEREQTEHAELILDRCLGDVGDDVVFLAEPEATEFLETLESMAGERGFRPITLLESPEIEATYVRSLEADPGTPEHYRALFESADGFVTLRAGQRLNPPSLSSTERERRLSRQPSVAKAYNKTPRCITQYPSKTVADNADISLETYREEFYAAVCRDWDSLERTTEYQRRLLANAAHVRIRDDESDLEFRVDGMHAVSDVGERTLPGGEVYTAPRVSSVTGHIRFSGRHRYRGDMIEDLCLTFSDGTVTDVEATRGEQVVRDHLSTDEGAKRVGEFGVGTNDGFDRRLQTTYIDEKRQGTIHIALGNAYERTVGSDEIRNSSTIHFDLVKDMEDGVVLYDGVPVLREGSFLKN